MSAVFNPSANVEALLGGYHAGASSASAGASLGLSQQRLALEQQQAQMAQAEFARQQAEHESAVNAYRGINLDLLDGLPHGTTVTGPRPQQVQPLNGMAPDQAGGTDPVSELEALGQGTQGQWQTGAGAGSVMASTPADPSKVLPQTLPYATLKPPQPLAPVPGGQGQGMEPGNIPAPDDEDTAKWRRMIQVGGLEANREMYKHLQTKKSRATMLRKIEAIRRAGLLDHLSDPKEKAVVEAYLADENPDEAIKALAQRNNLEERMQGMRDVAGMRGQTAENVAGINAGSRENVAGIGAQSRRDIAAQGYEIKGRTLDETIRHHGVAEGQGQQRVDQLGKPHAGAIVNDPVYRQHSDRYKNAMLMAASADKDSTNGTLPKDARQEAVNTRRLWMAEAMAAHQAMDQRTQELSQPPAPASPAPAGPTATPAVPAQPQQGREQAKQALLEAFRQRMGRDPIPGSQEDLAHLKGLETGVQ